ncbi:uncharacterized protein ARB_02065 [Trichophyton benhamiae CBS 112371]|uniref:3-ketoacyl-acyl carrier protein reductase n=1 Tax=Arthroderma benhamiae (strain ATCC MYA-4681 / CBS 112371) TaxID=663331 RepID=D4B0T9_ARTBC|nr:uncharacterized protein ARB_02065 [Trichophyton benhamiae CBS 112371]EFE30874.1 hypothetical protein ARB_02065 [Trichophyton benhamiae CBS 112371]
MAALNDIEGRLALVTGASSGLASRSVHLALTYAKNSDGMNAVVRDIKELPSSSNLHISVHQVDVGQAEQINRLFVEIPAEHGGRLPDILVSNAGYGVKIPQIWDISLEEFDHTINVNLRASFILVKGVVEHMKAQKWGRIPMEEALMGAVCGSSLSFFASTIANSVLCTIDYAASKGGMTGMMKNLATRLAQFNISVNDVAPAMIGETGMIPDARAIPEFAGNIPLGRLGTADEVANVVEMCVTTGYLTGQSILLAGGLK